MSAVWFARFGDIPGVTYQTPAGIDRSKLPGATARPEVIRFQVDGKLAEGLSWPGRGRTISTSQAPASQHADINTDRTVSAEKVMKRLAEVLELPGEPSDYHFAIQHTVEHLWFKARSSPALLSDLERLVWHDIELARAVPAAFYIDRDGGRQWFRITGLARLIRMYEREGAWHEALDVARIASTEFDQLHEELEDLTERVAAFEAEEA